MFLVAAIVCGVASCRFLFLKRPARRSLGVAAAELAVLFGAVTLVTGPLWARKAWGVWWVWDARLTSSLDAVHDLRRLHAAAEVRRPGSDKLGAGLALFGMANVPFIYVSVNILADDPSARPVVPTLPVEMGIPLWFCVAAFMLLFIVAAAPARPARAPARARRALYLAEDEA